LEDILEQYAQSSSAFLFIGNKTDVSGLSNSKEAFKNIPDIIFISAREDAHLDELKNRMFSIATESAVGADQTIITNARHYESLNSAYNSLQDILNGLNAKLPGDLLALDIRRCLHYLGQITGEITTEDQLDYIFSKFCIGK
jgi:tRNA modification GTPase